MAGRNALRPDALAIDDRNPLAPSTLPDGSPDPNATEGWQQLYRNLTSPTDWNAVASEYANALLMGSTAPGRPGLRVFHGSPHSFERFDLGKIGTGEGAQAYGHGLYFAEKEGTARSYRDALTRDRQTTVEVGGRPIERNAASNDETAHVVFDAIDQAGDVEGARSLLADAVARKQASAPDLAARWQGGLDRLSDWEQQGLKVTKPGHMYEVNIGADPEHFLHWDKPLSEQSPHVQKAIQSLHPGLPDGVQQLPNGRWAVKSGDNIVGREDGWPTQGDANYVHKILVQDAVRPSSTGQELYKRFSKTGDPAAAAQALQEAGIPGIRYLDAGSRAEGEGTHNLVVFDPATIEILRKYGLAGLGLGGAAAAGASPQSE